MSSRAVGLLGLLTLAALAGVIGWVVLDDRRLDGDHAALHDVPVQRSTTVAPGSSAEDCRAGETTASYVGAEGAMQTAIVGMTIRASVRCTLRGVEVAVGSVPGYPPAVVHQPDARPLVLEVGSTVMLSMQVHDTLSDERRPCTDAVAFRLLVNGIDVPVTGIPVGVFDCQTLRVGVTRPYCQHDASADVCRREPVS